MKKNLFFICLLVLGAFASCHSGSPKKETGDAVAIRLKASKSILPMTC